jgi:hypothetical protein
VVHSDGKPEILQADLDRCELLLCADLEFFYSSPALLALAVRPHFIKRQNKTYSQRSPRKEVIRNDHDLLEDLLFSIATPKGGTRTHGTSNSPDRLFWTYLAVPRIVQFVALCNAVLGFSYFAEVEPLRCPELEDLCPYDDFVAYLGTRAALPEPDRGCCYVGQDFFDLGVLVCRR